MFDLAAAVDPHADDAALVEQIARLQRVKSDAAAGQRGFALGDHTVFGQRGEPVTDAGG